MTGTPISDLLKISQRFLRSVNLERDFADSQALEGYVSTREISKHLQRIGHSLRPESGQRAWRITGDFGSGKSCFALALANLLGRPAGELPKGVRGLRKELGLRSNAPKLLPVLVTGSRETLGAAVLRSLHTSLSHSIDGRKKLQSKGQVASLLLQQQVTDRSAIEAIENASAELVSKGLFGGILLIIDEMGKFLEFAALHPEEQDVFFLQTLAESASRSRDAPIYTIGLLHQGFAEYADSLSTTAQREWAKVAERFEEITFSQPLGQVATLLTAALSLDSNATELWGWKCRAREDMAEAIDRGMFGPAPGKTALTQLAPDLYPLHSTVVPVLSRFFRRFGQNERSLFSFLLSSEPYALQDFATQDAGSEVVYRLADFYDFAAYNFSHRLGGQSFRSHWNHIDGVIRSAENEAPETLQLLKTVGILNVIESPELTPTREILSLALGHPEDLESQLKELSQRSILFNRGRAGFSLWPHTSVNLEQRLAAAAEALPHASAIAEVVQKRLDSRPIVARRHYIQTGNLRHFGIRFLTSSEFEAGSDALAPIHPADGLIAVILCESVANRVGAEKMAKTLADNPQLLVAISSPLESLSKCALELERWLWVERKTPELKDDRFAAEEVSRQVAISGLTLENRIQDYVGFRGAASLEVGKGISWFYQGKSINELAEGRSLQSFLSTLCDDLFSEAARIPNELVNRHSISTAAAAARQKLFKAMLESANMPLLGLPEAKAPPEKSMYLSVLKTSELHRQTEESWAIAFPEEGEGGDPCCVRPALDGIVKRLESTPDERVNVAQLYELLRSRPYGIRDGLIPILLLTVFITHETELAIYEDGIFKPDIEEFLLMRLARAPQTFEFQLCRINGVRRALITELATVVEAEHAENAKLLTIVRPLCLFVAELPDYVRNTDKLSPETLSLRKAIEAASEPADLVFHAIPRALGFSQTEKSPPEPVELGAKLGASLLELRRCFPELQLRMANAIKDVFKSELSLEHWRAMIARSAEIVLMRLADQDLRAFSLKLADEITHETDWLEALGSLLVRRPPSRWMDRDELAFIERLGELTRQFNRVLATCFDSNGSLPESAIRVALTLRDGRENEAVVALTTNQAKEVESLSEQLSAILPDQGQVSLAALSDLLWRILEDNKQP